MKLMLVQVKTTDAVSVGYLFRNEKCGITLASTYDFKLNMAPVTFFIPRKIIKKIIKLDVKE